MPAQAGIQFLAKYWVPASAGTSGQSNASADAGNQLPVKTGLRFSMKASRPSM